MSLKAVALTTNRIVEVMVTSRIHTSVMITDKARARANKEDTITVLHLLTIINSAKVINHRGKLTTLHRQLLHHIIKMIGHNKVEVVEEVTLQVVINNGKLNVEASKITEVINQTVAAISDLTHPIKISISSVSLAINLTKIQVLLIHATVAVTVVIEHFTISIKKKKIIELKCKKEI